MTAFDVHPDGALTGRRVWAELGQRVPDGICLDADGRIWFANALAPECVLIAEDGKIVEVVDTAEPCFACMLGGDDGRTLYMLTAPTSVSAIASQSHSGKVLAARVEVPYAGLP